MISVNSLSGGKTSSYMALNHRTDYNIFSVVTIEDTKCKPKDASLIKYVSEKLKKDFIATAEDDATLIVMRDLEQLLGREITWVSGISFDKLVDKTKMLPNERQRFCTSEMKIKPIFEWCYLNFDKPIKMNICFRFDEFNRVENMTNAISPNINKFAFSVNVKTQKQKWVSYKWRDLGFPLVRNGITKKDVDNFWKSKKIPATIFEPERDVFFPALSNCVGCFHKNIDTLATQAILQPEKMKWFASQEVKIGGTFKQKTTNQSIIENKNDLKKETYFEIKNNLFTCQSEGCGY